tara:strand:- start:749 stop:1246 length:498 start_codon:yes stop_codon:yes gene_type:complete
MKTLKTIIYITLILTFTACKEKVDIKKEFKQIENSESKKKSKPTLEKEVNEISDTDFDTFLKRFNKDSIFQKSRINFPMTVKELEYENYEIIEKIINLDNYNIIDLTIDKSSETREYDQYSQKTLIKENKAIIEIRGIDNGINCEYEFEKKNEKWKLVTWRNLSM